MTIETTRPPEGAKTAVTDAGRSKAAAGRTATAGAPADAGGGFADLMSSLAAADGQNVSTDASQPTSDDTLSNSQASQDDEKNKLLALDDKGLLAINLVQSAAPALTPVLVGGKGSGDKLQLPDQSEASLATSAIASDVTTLLNSRRVSQSHASLQGQVDSRESRLQLGNQSALAASELDRQAPILLSVDALGVPADRRDAKSATGQLRTGLEGAVGGAVADRLGISPTYEIAATSAVVPDTQVAETVSYWATQGVQSAELTLDGLGDEPVEVRISVEGDQTQVDFRSNQPDVRQALEAASAQLKTMLSGEGLQLTGMSVGTSGRGNAQSDGRQPKPAPRQATVLSMEPVSATAARPGKLSVGQALDLYV